MTTKLYNGRELTLQQYDLLSYLATVIYSINRGYIKDDERNRGRISGIKESCSFVGIDDNTVYY